jgi:hypothetical protein
MRRPLIFILVIVACSSNKNPIASADFIQMINSNPSLEDKPKLFNGLFCLPKESNAKTKYFVSNPIIFYKNGLIFWQNVLILDSSFYTAELPKRANDKFGERNWGTFKLSGDTIHAVMFIQYCKDRAQTYKYYTCYYQGIVDSNNDLTQWKMISPLPKLDPKFNLDVNVYETKPRTFYFKHFPAKALVDSNNVWVNDYRNKK